MAARMIQVSAACYAEDRGQIAAAAAAMEPANEDMLIGTEVVGSMKHLVGQ
jgi:hypothetical protein